MEELEERPFLRYLMSINDDLLKGLYESQSCVSAVFRMLPPVAQKCVLYLLYRHAEMKPTSDWRRWVKAEHQLSLLRHLELLRRLKIIEGEADDLKASQILLNIDFRMHFISSLLTDVQTLSQIKVYTGDEKARKHTVQDIFKKSLARWECILCHLAMPSDASAKDVSNTTRNLFRHVGLCSSSGGPSGADGEPEISSTGFQFLLLSRNQQIWHYLINYLRLAESQDQDLVTLIELVCRLSLCVGSNQLSNGGGDDETLQPFIIDPEWKPESPAGLFLSTLRELGLIFIRKRKDGWFFVTPLMASLFSVSSGGQKSSISALTGTLLGGDESSSASGDKEKLEKLTTGEEDGGELALASDHSGFLVVETNFRLYAYTSSTLQLAIISTFSELVYRFSSFAIGVITRESVRRALQTGITAKQIVQYLRSNAHPRTISKGKTPATVVDQIFLWEQERKRVVFTDAVLYSTFRSEDEYTELRDFAASNKLALWYSDERKLVVVLGKKDQMVREWWSSRD